MVVDSRTPQHHCRDFVETLQSSNLHYFVQETPFSLYVTVRKRFRNNSISGSAILRVNPTQVVKDNESQVKLENELRLKNIEFEKARASIYRVKGP